MKIDSDKFLRSLFSLMVQSKTFYFFCFRTLRPEFFLKDHYRTLFEDLINFYRETGTAPTYDSFLIYLSTKRGEDEIDEIKQILDNPPPAPEPVFVLTKEFAKRHALLDALFRVQRFLEQEDYDRAINEARQSLSKIHTQVDQGLFFISDFDEELKGLEKKRELGTQFVPTGLGPLDLILSGHRDPFRPVFKSQGPLQGFRDAQGNLIGGMPKGRFGLFFASAKEGKTSLLVYLASNALLSGFKVVYITLEESEDQIWLRLLARFLNYFEGSSVPFSQLSTRLDEVRLKGKMVKEQLAQIARKYSTLEKIDIYIQYLDPNSITIRDLEGYLDYLQFHYDFVPDVILIDYADMIRPTRPEYRRDRYLAGLEVYTDLSHLAIERDVALWTVSQVQRLPPSILPIRQNIRQSIGKIDKADISISFTHAKFEGQGSQNNHSRRHQWKAFYIDASRFTPQGIMFAVEADLATATFYYYGAGGPLPELPRQGDSIESQLLKIYYRSVNRTLVQE